jgi:hypothetical protein
MKLTRGKLIRGESWREWHESEWKKLEKYDTQGMFGTPEPMVSKDTVFRLVWTYNIKALYQWKKECCACDGSTRAGSGEAIGPHICGMCGSHKLSTFLRIVSGREYACVRSRCHKCFW